MSTQKTKASETEDQKDSQSLAKLKQKAAEASKKVVSVKKAARLNGRDTEE